MKKLTVYASILLISLISYSASAQAWHKGVKEISVGIGGARFMHFSGGNFNLNTAQIDVEGEFGVHDYVGVGFTTGFGFSGGNSYGYNGEINFPIGVIANFHFWKLLADKGHDMHSDKLDVYGGLNLGSGFASLFFGDNNSDVVAILFVGPQVGARYFFTDSFGVVAELGYGKSFVKGGVVFKID